MNRRLPSAWFGIAVVLAVQSAPTTAAASRHYTSPAGYALRYPAAWTRADGSPHRLLIVSPGRGARGPVIGPDQAAILVRLLDPSERVPPAAARVHPPIGASGHCRPWLEQEMHDASGPGPVEVDRSFYCSGDGRTILVQLTHWADDPRHAAYRRAAIAVAASVRFGEMAGPRPSAVSAR